MVSREERDIIQLVQGLGQTKSRPLAYEAPRQKFKNPPVEIVIPGQTRPHRSSLAVNNPYDRVGVPNTTKITNRTARQTLIGPSNPYSYRLTSRSSFPRDAPTGAASNSKGKGKAAATSTDSLRISSPEIIDVDSENPSTDELNLLDDTFNIKSQYFADNSLPGPSKTREHIPAARRSLVGDGHNTRQLQDRHGEPEHKAPSSSPIDSFTEEEGAAKDLSHRQGFVQSRVADIESSNTRQRLPIHDFRNRPKTLKDRMQRKSGPPKPQTKPTLPHSRDVLSQPSGLRSSASASKYVLPVSSVLLGIQEMSSYDSMTYTENARSITLSGPSVQPIGPINLVDTMAQMQATVPDRIIPPDDRIILYMKPSGASFNSPRQSDYSSVFQPGDDKKGQIVVSFNHRHKKWDVKAYILFLHDLKNMGLTFLRSKGTETLWRVAVKSIKYRDEPLHGTSTSLLNNTDEKDIFSEIDSASSTTKRKKELNSPIINSSTNRQRVTDSVARLGRPMAEEGVCSHKRPFDNKLENKDSSEVTDPPPKRQRLEDSQPLRRSTRNSTLRNDVPKVDQDEVVLVYPYGVPGAVNITIADLNRLQPDEFLNDTLIEFGLKSWLKELEVTYPELAAQVHVFNSFFYKKLNKRNIKEGYESVRKWTSKIDIFSKKYIIVPINEKFHWYLALIYEPEHVLQTPTLDYQTSSPLTRRQARESHISISSLVDQGFNVQEDTVDAQDNGTTSENEVEQLAIHASCSITITNNDQSTTSSAEEVNGDLVGESNERADRNREHGSPMDLDGIDGNAPIEIPDDMEIVESDEDTVTPSRYYHKPYTNLKSRSLERNSIVVERESPNPAIDPLRTKVFILDSLGTKHGQAMKQLSKWLEYEALDKRGTEKITPPITKMAPVPVQPNFCDCGLYLLHFAATFMKRPHHYCKLVMTKERPSLAERQADWDDASVATMREDLRAKILRFSDDWREQRAEREKEEKLKAEDEDSDVAIVEHVRLSKRDKSAKSYRTKS